MTTTIDLGQLQAERDHLQRELDNALAELNEAREVVPDTIGNPSEDSLARRIELLVGQSEDRISELETEVTRWRSEPFESSLRDRAIKAEDEAQRAAAEVARLVQQLDELRGVEAVRDGLLRQRGHLIDAIEALTEAVG